MTITKKVTFVAEDGAEFLDEDDAKTYERLKNIALEIYDARNMSKQWELTQMLLTLNKTYHITKR